MLGSMGDGTAPHRRIRLHAPAGPHAVTVGGDLEVTGTTTLTAAAGAGGGANATLNVGGDATLTGVVTLDDSTGTSTITFDGTGGAQTVSGGDIKGASANEGALVFGFVLEGSARLDFGGGHSLGPADAFVIPPREVWRLTGMSADFRLLHVTTRA